jgi:hypothetical protein
MKPTTYDLLNAAGALIHGSADLEPAEVDAALSAWVDAATDKAAALRAVVLRAETEAQMLHDEAKSLFAAAKQREAIGNRCRARMVDLLLAQELLGESPSIKGPNWSASLRRSKSVEVTNADVLPPKFVRRREVVEPDKGAIKAALEAGADVPGAVLREGLSVTLR